VESFDLTAGQDLDRETFDALTDPTVLKVAHNAPFELVTIAEHYEGLNLDPAQWFCTMIGAAWLGLPFGLGDVAKVLRLGAQKDSRGDRLISYFASPVNKPSKKDGYRLVNLPADAPEMWAEYIEYNRQDVYTESELFYYQMTMPQQPAIEHAYWCQDQRINSRGFAVDLPYIDRALEMNNKAVAFALREIKEITGVANPNSLTQIKGWLFRETGETFGSLGKDIIQNLLDKDSIWMPANVLRYFELRQISSKTSVAKYRRARLYSCRDRRNHGTIQYYGANRTGRYAGRGVQPHNMAKTLEPEVLEAEFGISDIAELRALIRSGEAPDVVGVSKVPKLISVMIRPAVIAIPGYSLIPNDFNAIEARVLAWLAGEDWRLDLFEAGGDIYKASYSKMFRVPFDKVTKDNRQTGKVAELALGYQGSEGAIAMMDKKGAIKAAERLPVVEAWRDANPAIVKLWKKVQNSAKHCIESRNVVKLKLPYTELTFKYVRGYLLIYLPSGRFLSYYGAGIDRGKLYYYGVAGEGGGWMKTPTYGGSLVENLTQAIARDILADAMARLEAEGLDIVLHVHDEAVVEALDSQAEGVLKLMTEVMQLMPLWAKGLPMKSSGFITKFYRKD
jgi:DNA polymerase